MSHYFTDEALGKTHEISLRVFGQEYVFISAPGVFSKDRLDTGTKLLLEESSVPANSRVLDLGCGIGVVGILLKLQEPTLKVTQSDLTDKAVALTTLNAKKLGATTTVTKSDGYDSLTGEFFDVILTNPPRAAGKKLITRLIEQAPAQLNVSGSLQLVAMTNKGGETYSKIMKEAFGNVEVIARGSGFKVYKSVKAAL